jgi:hypothetical protein
LRLDVDQVAHIISSNGIDWPPINWVSGS